MPAADRTDGSASSLSSSTLGRWLERLRADPPDALGGRIVHVATLPPVPARDGSFALPETANAILRRRSIDRLWSHQAEALAALGRGEDVVVATSTASGKSLVYNLAAAAGALADPEARALFVFPLKALEHDQLAGLRADLGSLPLDPAPTAEIYDGDTSPHRRRKIRERPPTVLLTTPDMLHAGILPAHEAWRGFLGHLALVVIDEVHSYRGVLGGHVAQVLRRLLRLARRHGAEPRVIACSATIGNPGSLFRELVGREATVVDRDGAPAPARHFACVEPEASPYTTAARLFRRCVGCGLRTIAFTQARRATELMHTWILEAEPRLASRISSYRAGFLPEERRAIERRLFSGELAGVNSTSALELGIDVGGLDVCILVGYPGSILAARQRAGRVGRAREGLVFLVPQADALDRYFLRHPGELLSRPCEDAIVDPGNAEILAAQLPCAAAEAPLRDAEPWLAERGVAAGIATACARSTLLESAARGTWFAARAHPAWDVSLRSVGETFAIRRLDGERRRGIGTTSGARVFAECHPGAVYLHHARAYVVRRLDLERREVEADGPLRVDHYTRALAQKETEILEVSASRPLGNALLRLGRLRVTTRVTRYEKRRIFGGDLVSTHALDLPPTRFETEGIWLELAPEIEDAIALEGGHFMGGIHGLEHAALALFPLFALCDRLDVAGISIPSHPQVRGPAVFLYDGQPGGIGIARAMFPRAEALLEATARVVEECPCEDGCPSCIHSPRCGAGNRPLDKRAVRRTLRLVLSGEPLPQRSRAPEPPPLGVARERAAPPAPPPLFLDVETQRSAEEVGGWHNIHRMRIALAVVHDAATGSFETYHEAGVERLLARLFAAPLVVGFNVRRFDYAVLGAYTARRLAELPTFDLLDDLFARLGRRISLGHLAEATLGREKSGDGLQSLAWFREGDLARVEAYCRRDVELLRDLFDFGQREGHVRFRTREGELVRLPVQWDAATLRERMRPTADTAVVGF